MIIGALAVCLVVGVADGDTLAARCGKPGNYDQVKVRLAEIDAPEKAQPFGQRSKQHLSDLCFGTEASIRPTSTDRYGRTVARVTCRGQDANAEQVRAGMAWAYDRYVTDPIFPQLQRQARATRIGLWQTSDAVVPWLFRRERRSSAEKVFAR